jgi:hypothetical protein
MGPNRRAQERERAAAEAAAKAKRAEAERKAVAEAQKIVAIWNGTIGAPIAAGLPARGEGTVTSACAMVLV